MPRGARPWRVPPQGWHPRRRASWTAHSRAASEDGEPSTPTTIFGCSGPVRLRAIHGDHMTSFGESDSKCHPSWTTVNRAFGPSQAAGTRAGALDWGLGTLGRADSARHNWRVTLPSPTSTRASSDRPGIATSDRDTLGKRNERCRSCTEAGCWDWCSDEPWPDGGIATLFRALVSSEMSTESQLRAGLTEHEVAQRVAAGKANASDRHGGRSLSQILRANVFTRFNAILGSLLVVVIFVGPLQDGLFGVVLVVNTVIGVGARAAGQANAGPPGGAHRSHRPRGPRRPPVELAADAVVLDDVLELRPGDQIVVDGLVLSADGLEIDESLLSGEAIPVVKCRTTRSARGASSSRGPAASGPSGSATTPSPRSCRVTPAGSASCARSCSRGRTRFCAW